MRPTRKISVQSVLGDASVLVAASSDDDETEAHGFELFAVAVGVFYCRGIDILVRLVVLEHFVDGLPLNHQTHATAIAQIEVKLARHSVPTIAAHHCAPVGILPPVVVEEVAELHIRAIPRVMPCSRRTVKLGAGDERWTGDAQAAAEALVATRTSSRSTPMMSGGLLELEDMTAEEVEV